MKLFKKKSGAFLWFTVYNSDFQTEEGLTAKILETMLLPSKIMKV